MRMKLSVGLCAIALIGLGCGKAELKPATEADARAQLEEEKRVRDEETKMRKSQPKQKSHEQTVEDEERGRRR